MILASTQITGYSLGLPLWWESEPTRLSTGCLQAITLTIAGNPTDVFLTRYWRQDNEVSLVFSTAEGPLCSLSANLSGQPRTYNLESETSDTAGIRFVAGAVTLFPATDDLELDLTGARVCPKYITFIDLPSSGNVLAFVLVDPSSQTLNSVSLDRLEIADSPSVRFTVMTSGGTAYYTGENTNTDQLRAGGANNQYIYYINGSAVSSGGFVLNLPVGEEDNGWRVSGLNNTCAKVSYLTSEFSCPADTYADKLSPGNFTQECPLEIAYSGGALVMSQIYDHRFNKEYDGIFNSSGVLVSSGLAWNEFSTLHDVWPQEDE